MKTVDLDVVQKCDLKFFKKILGRGKCKCVYLLH